MKASLSEARTMAPKLCIDPDALAGQTGNPVPDGGGGTVEVPGEAADAHG